MGCCCSVEAPPEKEEKRGDAAQLPVAGTPTAVVQQAQGQPQQVMMAQPLMVDASPMMLPQQGMIIPGQPMMPMQPTVSHAVEMAHAVAPAHTVGSLAHQVEEIRIALGLPTAPLPAVIEQAMAMLGLQDGDIASASLVEKADACYETLFHKPPAEGQCIYMSHAKFASSGHSV